MIHLSTKKGAMHTGEEHALDSNAYDGSIVGGNRKKSPTFGMNQARDHLGIGIKEIGDGDGRISPDLVGNKKGENVIGRESRVGSVGNLLQEKSIGGEAGGFRAFRTSPDKHTAHGKPLTKGEHEVMSNPNKRRSADKSWGWANDSVKEFLALSGRGESIPSERACTASTGDLAVSPSRGRSQSVVPRNMKRRSYSVQALPTFGPCKR